MKSLIIAQRRVPIVAAGEACPDEGSGDDSFLCETFRNPKVHSLSWLFRNLFPKLHLCPQKTFFVCHSKERGISGPQKERCISITNDKSLALTLVRV